MGWRDADVPDLQGAIRVAFCEAKTARNALLAFIADGARGEARFLIEDQPDGEAAITINGITYRTVGGPDRDAA